MKKTIYQLSEQIDAKSYLHLCTSTNSFMLMSKDNHFLYENSTPSDIKSKDPEFYDSLLENRFIIPDSIEERQEICDIRNQMRHNKEMYHVVINTTLDCNLNCWYCYENRIAGSRLSLDVISLIEKNVIHRYNMTNFTILKLSFFGGEPFLDFKGLQQIVKWANRFCEVHEIKLLLDFTTNATLINQNIVDFLRPFTCSFQITLDGDRERHNQIKVFHSPKECGKDTYQSTLNTLKLLNDNIPDCHIAVRINFDSKTLQKIDTIIGDISFLDRRRSIVILKKVWQVNTDTIDHSLLLESIQKFFDDGFLLDYYVMPKGCVCFADKESQALFNYDGKVFKCTTVSHFDENNALGHIDKESGEIIWKEDRIKGWIRDCQPKRCKDCAWFPICLGICNRQLIANPGKKLCNVEGLNLTVKEYLLYLFKFNYLKTKLYSNN